MAKLNDWNEKTEGVMHLLVTPLCARDCPHCCNKQYSLHDVPYATEEEFCRCHTVCLTGGEPFKYADPAQIAIWLKSRRPNVEKVYVYGNAFEAYAYLERHSPESLWAIDGLSLSIKTPLDREFFERMANERSPISKILRKDGMSNVLYVFDSLDPKESGNFRVLPRAWQEDFKPDEGSFFRKL
jgi:hypothetical protein